MKEQKLQMELETFTAEEIFHARRRKPNPRLSRGVPKGIKCELVAAGWPNWLVAAAGNALNGWLPRRADTFEFVDLIGQGAYSNAYKARDTVFNKVVALKKVRLDNLDPESVMFMAREIIILRRLGDHPSVIKLALKMYLVFDCMEYDLKGIQEHKGVKFSEPDIKCYMNQLLKGLNHCHWRGILHRDIKTSNLLVNKEGILKIADFGLSTFFDPEQSIPLTSNIVTLWYRPELLLGSNSYGVGVDLWGVGCVLGELFTGKPIMPGRTEVEQLHKIFKLCGSPSDDFWQKSKFPTAQIFKPIELISRAGIGGVLRNDTGHLIMAFSVPTQCKSNNQAEAVAALYAIEWCNRAGYDKYDLELDSMVITNMLKEKDTNNLKLKNIIKRIVNAMEGAEVSISHCYREANQVAGFLAKLASSSGNGTFYFSYQQLPKEAKGLFQLDRWQLPCIRRKYDKCNFFVS
ncbi:hypothetical protein KY284_029877 [Solanum tuberosum]|nr:hypothetical protein KY284_029877 [Solanum tuberosum]